MDDTELLERLKGHERRAEHGEIQDLLRSHPHVSEVVFEYLQDRTQLSMMNRYFVVMPDTITLGVIDDPKTVTVRRAF